MNFSNYKSSKASEWVGGTALMWLSCLVALKIWSVSQCVGKVEVWDIDYSDCLP